MPFLGFLVTALVLVEVMVRLIYFGQGKMAPHPDSSLHSEWEWAADHLAAGSSIMPGLAQYHPRLGWVTKPNLNQSGVQTNSEGIRCDREISRNRIPKKRRIVFVGDSYSFAVHVKNEESFPEILKREFMSDTEMINMGVGGYGPDQTLLRYELEGARYHPDIVVYGFYLRGFFRLFLSFRGYAKPYFVVNSRHELELKNSPVVSPVALYKMYASGKRRLPGWTYCYLLGWGQSVLAGSSQRERISSRVDPSWQLMANVLRRLRDKAVQAGSKPFLLIFPTRPSRYKGRVYEDIDRFAQEEARQLGIPFLSPTTAFADEQKRAPDKLLYNPRKQGGHLSIHGNRVLARLLYESLMDSGVLVGPGLADAIP